MWREYFLQFTDIFQVNGSKCDKDEKFKAVQYVHQLKVGLVCHFLLSFLGVTQIKWLQATDAFLEDHDEKNWGIITNSCWVFFFYSF